MPNINKPITLKTFILSSRTFFINKFTFASVFHCRLNNRCIIINSDLATSVNNNYSYTINFYNFLEQTEIREKN